MSLDKAPLRKRPILDLGKLVDSEAARLTGIISPREAELRADRDAYDAEQERIAGVQNLTNPFGPYFTDSGRPVFEINFTLALSEEI